MKAQVILSKNLKKNIDLLLTVDKYHIEPKYGRPEVRLITEFEYQMIKRIRKPMPCNVLNELKMMQILPSAVFTIECNDVAFWYSELTTIADELESKHNERM